ncbi:MAG: efflux family protein [Anaerocolumna sp.]|jgi:putative MATE family efflux protein|nr:efflux family protein [Anaerocolumna sp.]
MRLEKYDLTTGKILNKLLLIALPIMGTSFMQMAYNLVDMFWLGSIGSGAVAAAGTAGMFTWVSMSLMILSRTGIDIGVSQNFGSGKIDIAKKFAQTAFIFSAILGIIYMLLMLVFRVQLIGFFNITDVDVNLSAQSYLMIISIGTPFTFTSAVMTSTFNASGNSRVPFIVNVIGIGLNMILDPIFIFVLKQGINGAGIATVISQIVVFFTLVFFITKGNLRPFQSYQLFAKMDIPLLKQILKWSIPVALENLLFSSLTILINRMVAGFGVYPMAVMRVGSQIESLTWLIAGGYATALTTFIGQNFGARKQDRIRRGMKISFVAMSIWGLLVTLLMLFFGEFLMSIFLHEKEAITLGATYMIFLATCQISGSIENLSSSYLRGTGNTLPPSLVSIFCNTIRVPLAYFLSITPLGLTGLWIGFVAGAVLRGVVLIIVYLINVSKVHHFNYE